MLPNIKDVSLTHDYTVAVTVKNTFTQGQGHETHGTISITGYYDCTRIYVSDICCFKFIAYLCLFYATACHSKLIL